MPRKLGKRFNCAIETYNLLKFRLSLLCSMKLKISTGDARQTRARSARRTRLTRTSEVRDERRFIDSVQLSRSRPRIISPLEIVTSIILMRDYLTPPQCNCHDSSLQSPRPDAPELISRPSRNFAARRPPVGDRP